MSMIRMNDISIVIGGEAGAGISAAGFLLGKAFLRGGLHVFGTIDYPSLIRGGHNFYSLRAASRPILTQWDTIDLMIALDEKTISHHKDRMVPDGGIIYDSDQIPVDSSTLPSNGVQLYPIPLETIVKEVEGTRVVRNTVALGAAMGILGYDIKRLDDILLETFTDKGDEIVAMNAKAAREGHDRAKALYTSQFCCQIRPQPDKSAKRIFLTGNEAIALGAIAAGCKLYAAYPMTPASPVLHFLTAQAERFNIVTIQAESEIAAINMVIGAANLGVRAMTGTSGGGFCLMTEALGMAAMTETPIVVMLGQRTGPSTGLPTYTAQGDLLFAIHASQGEFPRVVIAPGDVRECFESTVEAFNLAEQLQMPVILLTDKHLLESHCSTKSFATKNVLIDRGKLLSTERYTGPQPYLRHHITPDGISPRLIPGTMGATTHSDSAVHNEQGFVDDAADMTRRMADKRYQKIAELKRILAKHHTIKIHGSTDAEVSLIGWGSTKGVILEALNLLKEEGKALSFLQVLYLSPFPAKQISTFLEGKPTIIIEENQTAQLASLIHEHTNITITHKILQYDGRPFNPLQLAAKIKEVL
ncbi:MAG: 2-oxoacid:acceptor oxidoreductase subunit alpha [Promethearchaeota archaeon]